MSFFPTGLRKDDDFTVPERIYHCKKCDNILLSNMDNYCSNCGRKLDKFAKQSKKASLIWYK